MGLNLSPREQEVWQLLVAGKSNQEIALCLGISLGTVKTYLHRLYRKLGVSGRVEAVRLYFMTHPFPASPPRGRGKEEMQPASLR